MPLRWPMLTHMASEKACRPQFVRIAEFFGQKTTGFPERPAASALSTRIAGSERERLISFNAGRRPVIERRHRAFDCGSLHGSSGSACPGRAPSDCPALGKAPTITAEAKAWIADLACRKATSFTANSIDRRHPAMTFYPCCRITVSLHVMAKNGILAHRE
jgi:hypothetical protein